MTRRTDRRLALLAGGGLAILLSFIFAFQVAAWSVGADEHRTQRVLDGPVDELLVDTHNGDVRLVQSTDDRVRIQARSKGTLHTPSPRVDVDGSRVSVAANCPVWSFGECHAEITVMVPASTTVRVHSRSGDIAAEGVSGGVDLETRSGDIDLDRVSGDVALETASGDIVARGLRASLAKANTASGDVDLRFAASPKAAEAMTASGDARILVPPGREAYNVSLDTKSGDTETGVRTDPDSTRFLRVESRSGDVTIDYGG
jgi:DUF4097 and DUF4098 domain-containing protein YvlB